MTETETVLYLSLVTASISFTVTETRLLKPYREWMERRSGWIGELFGCGYCLGHWVAFLLVAVYQPRLFQSYLLLDYFLTALVIAWIGGFQWVVMCWLMDRAGK
ncbi:MAG TPA: DUF1360 domain-containing protein [bacterium]|nr:DUF1360 domain-containing protein [bacterium]